MKISKIAKGFTLIELIIVVAIIGILAAVAKPAYDEFAYEQEQAEYANESYSPQNVQEQAIAMEDGKLSSEERTLTLVNSLFDEVSQYKNIGCDFIAPNSYTCTVKFNSVEKLNGQTQSKVNILSTSCPTEQSKACSIKS